MRVFKRLLNVIPLKKYVIFESNPDFSDNSYWLFKYLAERTSFFSDFKCIWFISDKRNKVNQLFDVPVICVDNYSGKICARLIRFYYTFFSKYIIDCNRYIYKRRSGQKRIYLTHGMPLKIPYEYLEDIGDVDLLPILGTCFVDFFSKYVRKENIKVYGLPRNDVFLESKASLEKYIVWMPTYRQHRNGNGIQSKFPLGIPVFNSKEELELIDCFLEKKGLRIMLRPHPAQNLTLINIKNSRNIIIADDEYLKSIGETLYSFIAHSAALITDYSSVYYDYLLLDRPIGVTFQDADDFSAKWPLFYKDIQKDLPGEKIFNIKDLKKFITNINCEIDSTRNERNNFLKKNGIKNNNACELIVEYMYKNMA